MTVVPFSSETMASMSDGDGFELRADDLKARRDEVAVLEARCGEDTAKPETTGWQRWLFPIAVASLTAGFAIALPGSGLTERGFAAGALGIWAALTAGKSVRAMRLTLSLKIQGSRQQMNDAVLCAMQAVGIVALARVIGPSFIASVPLFIGAMIAAFYGWQSGRIDPRKERMREDLQEARADLFRAEAAFEQELEEARTAFDADVERARETAGLVKPDAIAAE